MSKNKIRKGRVFAAVIILLLIIAIIVLSIMYALKKNKNNHNDNNSINSSSISEPSSQNSSADSQAEQSSNNSSEDTPAVNKDEWNLILVNKKYPMPENYEVKVKDIGGGHKIDERAYDDFTEMMNDAKKAGYSPIVCSSYRTMEKQKNLFNKEIQNHKNNGMNEQAAVAEASKWVAVPGTSEHQCGLALDIVSKQYQILDKKQEDTPEQKWLMENSYKYGFILRYPSDKADITQISYEPWHYRYVGKKAAKEIFERKICLEEYLNMK